MDGGYHINNNYSGGWFYGTPIRLQFLITKTRRLVAVIFFDAKFCDDLVALSSDLHSMFSLLTQKLANGVDDSIRCQPYC